MKTPLFALALVLIATPAVAQPDHYKLWGYPATAHADLADFHNWADVNRREESMPSTPAIKQWHEFLETMATALPDDKLVAVNDYFNAKPYITDTEEYHKYNYWADVQEFLVKGGDCKGYAVSKYFSLLQLGYTPSDLAIVVLLDQSKQQLHAVLAVFRDGDILILDNQDKDVKVSTRVKHYFPIYAITKDRYWTFQ